MQNSIDTQSTIFTVVCIDFKGLETVLDLVNILMLLVVMLCTVAELFEM